MLHDNNTEKARARIATLAELRQWLMKLDPESHYCGYELNFGIERLEIINKIDDMIAALTSP